MPASRSIHEQLYLGVDGGASFITVALANSQGQIVHQQTTEGGANYHALGLESAIHNLEQAIQDSLDQLKLPPPVVFDYSYFGLSGCNFPSDAQVLQDALKFSPLNTMIGRGFTVVNDSRIALRAGLPDSRGIALLVGTGSNCIGLDGQNAQAQSGGLDYIMSDEGSGYDIGLRTIKAVTRSLDGRGEPTKLTKEILTHLKVDNLEQLHEAVYRRYTGKAAIASLAAITSDVADQGDHVAQAILNHSVNELLKMVDAVMTKLDWRNGPISLVLIGSTILESGYMRRRFEAEVRRINPQTRTVVPSITPAAAAALLAKEQADSSQ